MNTDWCARWHRSGVRSAAGTQQQTLAVAGSESGPVSVLAEAAMVSLVVVVLQCCSDAVLQCCSEVPGAHSAHLSSARHRLSLLYSL